MSVDSRLPSSPIAADFDVGDDDDMPGLAQPITLEDIDALLYSPRGTVDERRAALTSMLSDLEARTLMDMHDDDLPVLIERIQEALSGLDEEPDGVGAAADFGFEPQDRVQQPDEILIREEDEADQDEMERRDVAP